MDYQIINYANKEDIEQMIMLDKVCYFGADVGDLEKCLMWLKICPEMYTIIKESKRIIGYINLLPVTKQCYDQIKSGQKKDYELSSDDVVNFVIGENYCLFMSIVIDKDFRISRAVTFLFDALKKKIFNLNKNGVVIKNIVADCITNEGEKLASHYNGKYLCETSTGSKIYEFQLGTNL